MGNTARVNAAPTKSFFVSMLTRDIGLEDAILDLLDNCVDGIIRSGKKVGPKPYEGYEAGIVFDAESFSISDNCGGIPWDMHNYAFKMGRPPGTPTSGPGAVGVYGIGMKRAIFKIGGHCRISTRNANTRYDMEIMPDWLQNEEDWEIPVQGPAEETGDGYTKITVNDLHGGIARTFEKNEGRESFVSSLMDTISTHYAYIMEKGFRVTINGTPVKPRTIKIAFDERLEQHGAIRPFVFKGTMDGVDVYLAVGMTREIPTPAEVEEQMAATRSSTNAGWTIVCNDRVVLHNDRTELTGWGEVSVPRYHTQFIAISGIVEFRSEDPSKLPTTTTKRGIDASSPLYLRVKNKMREGMKVFTDHTNKWKGRQQESAKHIERCKPLSLPALKKNAEELEFKITQTLPYSRQYKPSLPVPPKTEPEGCRISFIRGKREVTAVAEYLKISDTDSNRVGEECFDAIHEETEQ